MRTDAKKNLTHDAGAEDAGFPWGKIFREFFVHKGRLPAEWMKLTPRQFSALISDEEKPDQSREWADAFDRLTKRLGREPTIDETVREISART